MRAGGWRRKPLIFGLVVLLFMAMAIFNCKIKNCDFLILHYASVLPSLDLHALRKLESDQYSSANKSVEHRALQSPAKVPPSCFRQVQIWMGSNETKEPVNFKCPGLDCGIRFVEDTSFETMKRSDAVVLFHRTHWDWDEMLSKRPSKQVWVFYSLESPLHTGGNAVPPWHLQQVYNYTMTYRPSSTIHAPYGIYENNVPNIPQDDHRNWAEEKTGMVAWMASNCQTASWDRYWFVQELSRYVQVDIYGACGNLICDRDSDDCWNRIRTYKFYLAVENSECRDYITEKFWRNALQHDVVPIVYGAPKKDYLRVAPPNSFIHLQDFESMRELVDYLSLLNSNDTLYNSYFEWKRHGSVRLIGEEEILLPPFLCKLLSEIMKDENGMHTGKRKEAEKKPMSINEWWSDSCFTPQGFPHYF